MLKKYSKGEKKILREFVKANHDYEKAKSLMIRYEARVKKLADML